MPDHRYLGSEASELFDLLPDPLWVFDAADLRFLYANRPAQQRLGYGNSQLLTMTIADIRPPEDVPALRAALASFSGDESSAGVWRLRPGQGADFHADLHWRRVRYLDRDAILVSARDVTRQLEAMDALQEKEAYLRTAERLLGLGIWQYNLDTGALRWINDVHQLYGLAPDATPTDHSDYSQLVHPDDRQAMLDNLTAYLAHPTPHFHFLHRVLRGDGGTTHVRGLAELTTTDQGRVLVGVVRDITEEVESARQLNRAANLLAIAGRIARLGAWRASVADNALEWSEVTRAIHEIDSDQELSIEDALAFYPPDHRSLMTRLYKDCVEQGTPYDQELQMVTAKGRRIWVRVIGEPEYDSGGQIVAVRGAIQDVDEQVRMRDELAVLSRQLYHTLENMHDAFMLLDSDLRFIYVNRAAEEALYASEDALTGKSLASAFPFADTDAFAEHYQQALSDQVKITFTRYYTPLKKWFRVEAHPVPEGLAVYFRDVSDEWRLNEQLRLLEAAVANQNDMLVITEAEPLVAEGGPKIVFVNDAFVRRTGYSRQEVIGRSPRILHGPRTDRNTLLQVGEAMKQLQPIRTELLYYTRDSEEFWVEMDVTPLANNGDDPSHWVVVQRDISERKESDRLARLHEERFKIIARATSDVIWDWDLENGTVWWNEGIYDLFGYPRESLEPGPESWSNRIHPEDLQEVLHSIHQVIDGSGDEWECGYRFMGADGRARHVIDKGFVIRDANGRGVRMIGGMVDITEQRTLEERLQQAQKLEAIGQLTGGVAHDFNNLLTVILGNAELLKEQLTDQQQLRLLAEMTATAAERGAELTGRLLAFARRQPLEPRRLDVNRLLSGMEGLLRRTLAENIEIELVQAGGLWPAEVDPSQLESAILNLSINARDAMPEGGRLTIETANTMLDDSYAAAHQEVVAGQYVRISVSDTGSGMAPQVLTQAFEPFFTTKEVGKGSGLGLSMVYGFVKQSGGHIKIYSEPGEGTTIKLYFPRVDGKAGDTLASGEGGDQVARGREHVLLVEDDTLVRQHVQAMLEGLGYRVTCAADGQEALDAITLLADVDLLFTDVIMPGGINGRQLADRALALRPGLKVLFTSGYTENAIVHQGRLDRGVHLLSKPYRRQDLAAKVRKVLDESDCADNDNDG